MHESTPRPTGNLDELRVILDKRLANMRQNQTEEQAAVQISDEATGATVEAVIAPETQEAMTETPITPVEPQLETELQQLREAEENLKAKKQRVLDEAAEKAERLRAQAEEIERQRLAEIAAAEAQRQREIDAEIARRKQAEAEAAAERQRIEAERLAAEAKIAKQQAETEAAAEAERPELVPDTLEHPSVKKTATVDTTSQADVIELPTKKKRRVWPMVAAVASCVALGAGGAVATGNDGGAVKRARGLIDKIYPSQDTTPSVRGATVRLPKDIIKQAETTKKKPEPKKKEDEVKKRQKRSDIPASETTETQNSHVAITPAVKPAPALETTQTLKPNTTPASKVKETGGAKANTPEGLTAKQANPANYTSNEPTGATPYGSIPTEQGGAAPFVAKTP